MNTMKKNGGFTLVELIIVIAILAILSTGAIAGYSAYIQRANDAAVEAVLSDISTAAVLANAQGGPITSITVENGASGKIKFVITAANLDASDNGFEYLFEKSVTGVDASISEGTDTNPDTYTFSIDAPKAWNNSSYNGKVTSWSTVGWGEPASTTTPTTAPADNS